MASTEPRVCSIARTLDIVGEKWALLAVREVFLANRRFDEMVRRTGAPRDTLAARLRTLVGAGILERRQYSDHPARFEYHLTDAGRDLYPVIVTLMRWGDQYLAATTARRWSCGTGAGTRWRPRWYARPAGSRSRRATPSR
jgi:DNA-binding HxlR family transcriptional regulator